MKSNSTSDKKFCVYKITNLINEKIYIGKTFDIQKRWNKHLETVKYKGNGYQYLHKSIEKYGVENFLIESLEVNLNEELAFEREKFWIKELNSNNPNIGMNLTIGGEGVTGHKWSEEQHSKLSGSNHYNYGKSLPMKTKEKLSLALSGANNPMFDVHLIPWNKGIPATREQKQKNREAARGEKSVNAKLSNEDVLEIRKKWDNGMANQTELAKQYNVKPNTINQIVNRKRWIHI